MSSGNRVVPFDSKVDDDGDGVSYKEQEMSSTASSVEDTSISGGTLLSTLGSVGSFFSSEEEDSKVHSPPSSTGKIPTGKQRISRKSSSKKARVKGRLNSVAKFGTKMMRNLKSLANLRQQDLEEDEILEKNIEAAQAEIIESGESPLQIAVLKIIEHWGTELFMMVLTVYALFGADMNQIYGGKESDDAFGYFSLCVMAVFFLEMILTSIAKPKKYIWSTYFWLDFIAAASLLGDVPYFNQEVIGNSFAAARAGRASKAGTRAARIVRVIRLIRLTRLIRLMKSMRGEKDVDENDDGDQMKEEEENASAISNRLSEFTTAKIIIGLLFMMLAMMLINPGEDDTTWADSIEQMSGTCSVYVCFSV
jgi:hypothetical protein